MQEVHFSPFIKLSIDAGLQSNYCLIKCLIYHNCTGSTRFYFQGFLLLHQLNQEIYQKKNIISQPIQMFGCNKSEILHKMKHCFHHLSSRYGHHAQHQSPRKSLYVIFLLIQWLLLVQIAILTVSRCQEELTKHVHVNFVPIPVYLALGPWYLEHEEMIQAWCKIIIFLLHRKCSFQCQGKGSTKYL